MKLIHSQKWNGSFINISPHRWRTLSQVHDLDQIARIFYHNTRVPILNVPSNGWSFRNKWIDKSESYVWRWCPKIFLNQIDFN